MEIKYTIGKHEFTIIADKDALLNEVNREFEENYYVDNYNIPDCEKYINEETFNKNVIALENLIESTCDVKKLEQAIENFPKKKNGTLNRRLVDAFGQSGNQIYICEWHNTWIYQELRFSAVDDKTLKLSLYRKVNTPG